LARKLPGAKKKHLKRKEMERRNEMKEKENE
jgi:hypothetical protein